MGAVAWSRGLPSTYTAEIGVRICEAIATTPRGLAYICRNNPEFPNHRTVVHWLMAHDDFRADYELAKEMQADLLFDETLEIADDDSGDRKLVTRQDGSVVEVMDGEFVARSKVRIDTRFKVASKLKPKVYGDKIDVTARVGFTRQEDALAELT